jgi:hypothetical protein
MIDEDDLPKAIYDFAMKKYDSQLGGMCEKYSEEFPEKDCELPDEAWFRNFLCWLFFEKVLPETGKTIAEEFAEQSPELTPQMRRNIPQMRKMIRADFLVISARGAAFRFKDIHTNAIYDVKGYKDGPRYPLNTIVTGRIFPCGDHYRTTGFFFFRTTPFIVDPDILMNAYDNEQVARIEDIQLRKGSSFQSVMNKYPSRWVDWMCDYYQIHQRLKKEKVREIEYALTVHLSDILKDLPKECRDVLRLCLHNGGLVKYRMLKHFDDGFEFFWGEQPLSSTIGMLRQRGLLFVGKMWSGERNYKVAFVPIELRGSLEDLLASEKRSPQRQLA